VEEVEEGGVVHVGRGLSRGGSRGIGLLLVPDTQEGYTQEGEGSSAAKTSKKLASAAPAKAAPKAVVEVEDGDDMLVDEEP